MNIREYTLEDRDGIEKCIFELQKTEYSLAPDHLTEPEVALKSYFVFLSQRLKEHGGTIFVAENGGKVVGCVSVMIDTETSPCVAVKKFAYIPDLAVLEEFRNQGIGKMLIERAEQFGRDNGLDFIFLDVMAKNPAVDFYHKIGFIDQGLRMEKKLNE